MENREQIAVIDEVRGKLRLLIEQTDVPTLYEYYKVADRNLHWPHGCKARRRGSCPSSWKSVLRGSAGAGDVRRGIVGEGRRAAVRAVRFARVLSWG